MSYKYRCPTELGYRQIKLTKQQHNDLFKNQNIKWYDKYEYYYSRDKGLRVDKFYNWKLIALMTLLYPINILIEGFGNIKEINRDYTRMYKQKQYGSFVSERYYKDKPIFEKVKELTIGCKIQFISN